MSFIHVFDCLCQNCKKVFKFHHTLCNCINIDVKDAKYYDFLSHNLNKVYCPHCKTSYTYEIPMVVLSLNHKFAIKVNPAMFVCHSFVNQKPPYQLLPQDFKFREVCFQIEALEKVRILTQGYDDITIEQFKLKMFKKSDAIPFDEINLVYSDSDNNNFYFEKYNCNNKLLYTYKTPKQDYKETSIKICVQEWNIINRITVNNYILKEN